MIRKLLYIIATKANESPKYCWTWLSGLLGEGSKKTGFQELLDPSGASCRQYSIDNEMCYCGKYMNGKTYEESHPIE